MVILLGLLGIDWASGYAIAGYVMQHGVTPLGYAMWQVSGPFIFLLAVQLIKYNKLNFKFNFKHIWYYLFCALFGIVLPNGLVYFASQYVASGILTVIANLTPILIYLFAILLRQENFKLMRITAVLIGVLGVLLLLHPQLTTFTNNSMWLYIALLIPVSYAFSIVFIARFKPSEVKSSLNSSMLMLFFATLFIVPVTLISKDFYSLAIGDFNSQLIILEIILSSIGYVLLFLLIKLVGPVYYTITNTVAAITGVIYGRVLFGQYFNHQSYIAIIIIIAAILGLTFTQNKKYNAV